METVPARVRGSQKQGLSRLGRAKRRDGVEEPGKEGAEGQRGNLV